MANQVEVKKGIVKSIDNSKEPYNGQHGTLYKYDIVFENGDAGEYSSKSNAQDKFVIGQEVDYEVHINPSYPNFPKIKPHYAQKGFSAGGGGKQFTPEDKMRMAKSVAIKSASIYFQQRDADKKDIKAFADFCYEYITDTSAKVESTSPEKKDDMPF